MGRLKTTPSCHPDRPHQAHGMCLPCYNHFYRIRRRSLDPTFEKYPGWKSHLKTKYGLTPTDFYDILKSQGGHCKLCSLRPESKYKNFCVDHDHKTGKIRGILCKFCNSKLGWYENRKDLIGEYLK